MKKTNWIIIALFALFALHGCNDEIGNPGDFSIPSELSVIQVYDTAGNYYQVDVSRAIDTTYVYFRTHRDTLKDESGQPLLDPYGNLQIEITKEPYISDKVAKYFELETILLESPATELHIELNSNARWQAPTPDFGGRVAWYNTTVNAGGGDGKVKATVSRGRASGRRPFLAEQFIFSRDSTVLFKLTFDQKGRDE